MYSDFNGCCNSVLETLINLLTLKIIYFNTCSGLIPTFTLLLIYFTCVKCYVIISVIVSFFRLKHKYLYLNLLFSIPITLKKVIQL